MGTEPDPQETLPVIPKPVEISSFDDDLFDLKAFAERLEKFIAVEQHFVPASLVIALNSRYGSGKSTFLRMWESRLTNDVDAPKVTVVKLNAWESDYYGDPLFAIVSSLIESLRKDSTPTAKVVAVRSAISKVGRFAVGMANQAVVATTGMNPIEAGEYAEKGGQNARSSDPFDLFERRKGAMVELRTAIGKAIEAADGEVWFFVDELDRCRPDYAIQYLETIKHIFDVPDAVFILAADRDQLQNSAKMAFGIGLDFDEYYRKFVHREIRLPKPTEQGYSKIIQSAERYFNVESIRSCYMNFDGYSFRKTQEIATATQATPRQLHEAFRILGHLLAIEEGSDRRLKHIYGTAAIAIVLFKLTKPQFYARMLGRTATVKEFVSVLGKSMHRRSVVWWCNLFAEGGAFFCVPHQQIQRKLEEADIDWLEAFRNPSDGWDLDYGEPVREILTKIEEFEKWVE